MTNLTLEQIREAVELAEGIEWPNITYRSFMEGPWEEPVDMPNKHFIAALASQLKSQVDAIEDYSVEEFHDRSAVVRHMSVSGEYVEFELEKFGPNRDDNSILVCTEFLRGR